jgi:hypothetical protein
MKTIASKQSQYSTRFLTQGKSGAYFVGDKNGGYVGSHQPKDQVCGDWGFWINPLRVISDAEAEVIAYEMNAVL